MAPFLTLWTYLQSRTARREDGVVAVEYVILAGLVIVAVTAVFVVFGPALTAKFSALL